MAEHDTTQFAGIGTSGVCTGLAIPLADEQDKDHLSGSLAFLRQQLEFFQATAEDVDIRRKKGGRQTVCVGQVGIRCVHCAHRPADERSNGAVAFPTSTGQVYQAARNWQRKFIYFSYICGALSRLHMWCFEPFTCAPVSDFIDMLWPIARSSAFFLFGLSWMRFYFDERCMPCSHSSSPIYARILEFHATMQLHFMYITCRRTPFHEMSGHN